MAKSKYEKNVIRKPAVIRQDGSEEIANRLDTRGKADKGALTWYSRTFDKDAESTIEFARR